MVYLLSVNQPKSAQVRFRFNVIGCNLHIASQVGTSNLQLVNEILKSRLSSIPISSKALRRFRGWALCRKKRLEWQRDKTQWNTACVCLKIGVGTFAGCCGFTPMSQTLLSEGTLPKNGPPLVLKNLVLWMHGDSARGSPPPLPAFPRRQTTWLRLLHPAGDRPWRRGSQVSQSEVSKMICTDS